jgi:hypothetical protein
MLPKHQEGTSKGTEWKIINGESVKITPVVVHSFTMGDVDDPDIYAANPLWEWQTSDMGKWVMKNSVITPEWYRVQEPITYGHKFYILARLREQDLTFWTLKWKDIK